MWKASTFSWQARTRQACIARAVREAQTLCSEAPLVSQGVVQMVKDCQVYCVMVEHGLGVNGLVQGVMVVAKMAVFVLVVVRLPLVAALLPLLAKEVQLSLFLQHLIPFVPHPFVS